MSIITIFYYYVLYDFWDIWTLSRTPENIVAPSTLIETKAVTVYEKCSNIKKIIYLERCIVQNSDKHVVMKVIVYMLALHLDQEIPVNVDPSRTFKEKKRRKLQTRFFSDPSGSNTFSIEN